MSRLASTAFALLALAAATRASAQELNLATTSAARPDVVALRTGMDHAFLAELGYRRVLGWGERQVFVGGDVATPWARPDLGDYRIRATLGLPLGSGRWRLAGWLSPTLRGTGNDAVDLAALGADLRLTGGWYARRWFVAAEAGLDWVAATRVTFSDAYRTRAYAGARDGWYRTPGGTTYAGLHGGVSFSSLDVIVRAGHPRSTALAQQTVPFYLTVGLNVALPR
jgi:hypothetical protein